MTSATFYLYIAEIIWPQYKAGLFELILRGDSRGINE